VEPEEPADDVAGEAFDSKIEATADDVPDEPVDAAPESAPDEEPELVAETEPEAEEPVAEPAEARVQTTGLAGFDTAAGVAEVGGNAELYRSLLIKFRQDYVGAADKIGTAIEKNNVEIAHLLLNAIKGVAGVLGAVRVHATGDELETSLIGGNLAVTRGAHGQFSAALDEALESIAGLDAGAELIIPPAGGPEEHVSDPMVLRSYLEGLRQHLEGRKQRQCQLVIREITARTWPEKIKDDVDRLARSIRDDRYDEAQGTFDKLISKLEG